MSCSGFSQMVLLDLRCREPSATQRRAETRGEGERIRGFKADSGSYVETGTDSNQGEGDCECVNCGEKTNRLENRDVKKFNIKGAYGLRDVRSDHLSLLKDLWLRT